MTAKRGLFLDLDGTLADSIDVLFDAYSSFLDQHGCAGSRAEFAALDGVPLRAAIAAIATQHGLQGDLGSLLECYERLVDERYTRVRPVHGAAPLIAAARARGYAVAVVTSGVRSRAARWLEGAGLSHAGDVLVGGDCVERGKPDPAPYLLALERSGCSAGHSLAVEDSAIGVQAARAAGLRTLWLQGERGAGPAGAIPVRDLAEIRGHLAHA